MRHAGAVTLKWLLRLLVAGLSLALLLALAGSLFLFWLSSEPGREWLTDTVTRVTADSPAGRLTLVDIGPGLPWRLRADGFAVADSRGIWLSGRKLDLAVSPWKLLQGRLHLTRVRARSLTWHRPPEPGEAWKERRETRRFPDRDARLELPPLGRFSVADFGIPVLVLEPRVAGRRMIFALYGGTTHQPGKDTWRLDIRSRGEHPDVLSLEARLLDTGQPPRRLEIEGRLREGRGGFLAHNLGLGAGTELRGSIRGAAPLTDWLAEATFSAKDAFDLEVQARFSIQEALRVELEGRLEFSRGFLDQAAADRFGRSADFSLKGGLGQEEVVLESLLVDTLRADLSARGRADLHDQGVSGRFVLDLDGLRPLLAEQGYAQQGPLALTGKISGSVLRPVARLFLDVKAPSWRGMEAQRAELRATLTRPDGEAGGLQARVRAGLARPDPGADWFAPERLELETTVWTRDFASFALEGLSLQGPGILVAGQGVLDRAQGLSGRVDLKHLDLSRHLGRAVGLTRGELSLSTRFRTGPLEDDTPDFEVSVSGRLDDPAHETAVLDRLAGGGLDLSLQARGTRDRVILDKAGITGRHLGVLASGRVRPEARRLDLDLGLDLGKLALVHPRLEGAVSLDGGLAGPLDNLALSAGAAAERMSVAGHPLSGVRVEIEARNLTGTARGSVYLDARSGDRRILGSTGFAAGPGKVEITALTLEGPGIAVDADLLLDTRDLLARGVLRADAFDLGEAAGHFGIPAFGQAMLEASLNPVAGRQNLEATFTSEGSRIQRLEIGRARIQAAVESLFSEPGFRVSGEAGDLAFGELTVADMSGRVSGTPGDLTWGARAKANLREDIVVRARGRLGFEPTPEFSLQTLTGGFGPHRISLVKPLVLRAGDHGFSVPTAVLLVGSGRMVLSGELRRQHVRGELTARGLPVILAKRFLPAPISGNLDADLDIRGVPARPRVDLRLRGKRLRPALPRYSDAEPLDADLTAALADGRLTAGFRATGLGPEATTARVGMDLDFSLVPLKATLPAGAALSATAQGSVALELLQGYLLWTGHAVDGLVTYRARADGPARRPAISASLDLEDANYENAGTGLVLRDMQGRVRTRDTSLILEEFSARDPEGGGISAHGVLAMNWAQGLPFEINLAAEDLALLRRDDIQAEASASLRLDGNMDESGLTGTMTLTPVHVRIPDTMPAEVAEVDVRQINTPEVQAPPRPRRESRHVMTLDADLILPGPFTVQGHGLDSQWTGALHLEGTAAKPVIKGRLDLARGTFNFLNKRFTLTEGELYFPGTHPPQPHINLRAEAKSGDVTAIVVLRGEAASPDLSLLSDPALPKDEILARILFGKSLSTMTPLQAVTLANAARQLAPGNAGTGFNVMSRTQEALGVDNIDIKRDEEGTSVGVGKYVLENVYIEVDKGVENQEDKVRVEIELTPSIGIESEAGTNAEGGVGLYWKKDY